MNGTPVQGARIVVTNVLGEAIATGTTDTHGAYAFTPLPAGTYTLTVTAYQPSATTIEIGSEQTRHDVELLAGAQIRGTVHAEGHRPLPDARVTLLAPPGTWSASRRPGPTDSTPSPT